MHSHDKLESLHREDASSSAPSSSTTHATGPRRRFRFSLLTLLLATAVVCLAVSHFRTSHELYRAHNELQRLREEAGYLQITDPRKVHVLGVRTYEDMLWKWRVYLPEGRRYQVFTALNGIPATEFPDRHASSGSLGGGEYTLSLSIYRDYKGEWKVKRTTEQRGGASSVTSGIPEEDAAWLVKHVGLSTAGVMSTTQTFEPEERVVLLRLRVHERDPAGGSSEPRGPSDGVMLWIAPAK